MHKSGLDMILQSYTERKAITDYVNVKKLLKNIERYNTLDKPLIIILTT